MSQSQLERIARCLAAAGYVEQPEQEGLLLLFVEAQEAENVLVYKLWTGGTSFDQEEFVTQNVRPGSPAAYLITPANKYIVCITSSSILQILEYNCDADEWDVKPIPRHEVHRNGKFAAFARTDRLPDVFFQDWSKRLIYFDMTSGKSVVLPSSPAVGSPIFVDVFKGKMYIFYISAKDYYIHYLTMQSDGRYKDYIMTKCEVKGDLKQLSVVQNRQSGAFDGYVLTEKHVLLYIRAVDRQKVVLGKVDAAGNFKSRGIVHQYCNDALNGTLTMDRLQNYLENDPSIIDSPGGEYNVTALAGACSNGHLDIVRLLLAHNADPNALSPNKRTPLFYATSRSPRRSRYAIVRALLDAGADVDECKEVVDELLNQGPSSTATNSQGLTADDGEGDGVKPAAAAINATAIATADSVADRHATEEQFPNGGIIRLPFEESDESRRPQAPSENVESSEFRRQLMEFVVTLIMLLVTYTDGQDVLDDILNDLKGIDGSTGEI